DRRGPRQGLSFALHDRARGIGRRFRGRGVAIRRQWAISRGSEPRSSPMSAKPIRQPGADHPITVEPNPSRIVVSVGGRVVADTTEALALREAGYPPVQYIPRKDVAMALLERTDHATYCPYKGDCAYYS